MSEKHEDERKNEELTDEDLDQVAGAGFEIQDLMNGRSPAKVSLDQDRTRRGSIGGGS
ncbi:MAG: hypothetical protein AAGE01_24230 [Pseudomonadota bacterium]